ncbi:MAG: histidinol-phosphate transaminase [Clostridia bacterium]|nr:histidinol-phosphate transaminase [Clostridia bacterium]
MSKFFNQKLNTLVPYTPGEQPKEQEYIKLNTNECAYAPSEKVLQAVEKAAVSVNLYPDPACDALCEKMARIAGMDKQQIIFTNGSDEILNFIFTAFCENGAVFPDITYGFYPVFARLNGVKYREIPLTQDLRINPEEYKNVGKTIFIANPNAPTGIALKREELESIIRANPDNLVVIDEAYADFSGESARELVNIYDNLIVCGTFSKSRSAAGIRLGFAFACKELISDLNTIRFSTNPYNINSLSMAAGLAILEDEAYTAENVKKTVRTRERVKELLKKEGFYCTDSKANFLFVKSDKISGEALYRGLKQRGILIRHFSLERIREYNRISIGTDAQMDILIKTIKEMVERK